MDTISDISSLVKLGELFLADISQELVLLDQSQIEAKGHTYLELGSLSELKILQLSMLKIQLQPVGLDLLRKLTKLSLCYIHLKKLPRLPSSLFTLSLPQYKLWTRLPDLSYLELLLEFELFDCAVEFSKPANTKHSSIQGVKCKDKGSSTTWHRVAFYLTPSMNNLYLFQAIASKFSCQIFSEPDKNSRLSVDSTGTETSGILLSTEQEDMPLDRASTIPSLATIGSAVPPAAAQAKSSSATNKDKAALIVEADYAVVERNLFSQRSSLC
ncbi:hypothetical protein ACJRO7_014782 [Eucalyptus globulus]|uniref:Uncharacterized protein n=1 Tax=Eucalyptus globulus TaxID=34317 RepID=A0ABD3L757_EUCGL